MKNFEISESNLPENSFGDENGQGVENEDILENISKVLADLDVGSLGSIQEQVGDLRINAGKNEILKKFLSWPIKQQTEYLKKFIRGQRMLTNGLFVEAKYPLVGKNVKFQLSNAEIHLGQLVEFTGNADIVLMGEKDSPSILKIGPKASIGSNIKMNLGPGLHEIGAECSLAWDINLISKSFHSIRYEDGSENEAYRPIRIGDRVWIQFGVIILPGVTIGSDTVIGAGSVVAKDIPDHCFAAGNPARPIRKIKSWHR